MDKGSELRTLLLAIRKDPKYKKFVQVVERATAKLDIERDREEAMSLHATRISRAMYGRDRYSSKKLIDASWKDAAARARLVEMRVKADVNLKLVQSACEAIKRHILTEYQHEMRMFRNAENRNALIKRVHGTAQSLLSDGEALTEMFDHLIRDIDQTSHLLTNVRESMKMLTNVKGRAL